MISLAPEALGVYNENGERVLVPGEYEIFLGMSQPDSRSCELLGTKPLRFVLSYDGAVRKI